MYETIDALSSGISGGLQIERCMLRRFLTDRVLQLLLPALPSKPSMFAACVKRLPLRAQVKAEIQEVVQFLRNPRRFLDLGARSPAGILLVGPPGTGAPLGASQRSAA